MAALNPRLNTADQSSTLGTPKRVAVVLSQQLACVRPGLDLAALQGWLAARLPEVAVFCAAHPLQSVGLLEDAVATSHAERLILGLAAGESSAHDVQTQARKAGLDPLGVHIVNLEAHAARYPHPAGFERAKLLLAAAVAKVRAYPGSKPEHLKAVLSVTTDRRAAVTFSLHEYRAVPAIVHERCAAAYGCHQCADVCPRRAIRITDAGLALNKAQCESCGLCVTACAWDALDFPGYSQEELDAYLATLLMPALADLTPRGILFLCQAHAEVLDRLAARSQPYPAGWLPAIVPCTGMLSVRLLLRCLAWGAAAVGIVPCATQCPFGQSAATADRVAFCQRLLEFLQLSPDHVTLCPLSEGETPSWPLPARPIATLEQPLASQSKRNPRTDAAALLALAEAQNTPKDLALTHPAAPFGVVELRSDGCTACEACVAACPTSALASERDSDGVTLSFDAALCVACGLCVPRCPETERGVIRLHHKIDLPRLAAGRTVLYRDRTPRCAACGAPIAPAAMLARIADVLGPEFAPLTPVLTRYCTRCRGGPLALG
jgi:ferredoxin